MINLPAALDTALAIAIPESAEMTFTSASTSAVYEWLNKVD